MSGQEINRQRRSILKIAITGAAGIPLGALLMPVAGNAGDLPPLDENDSVAKGLGYVHDASAAPADKRKPGTFCKNCNLIQSKEGEWRPCSIIPGKAVNENGWCIAWVGRV